MNENIIVPPPPSNLSSQIETGAGGVQTQITEKTLIRVFFLLFFFCNYNFLRFKRVETFIGGWGVQLFIIFFWGGGGGQILISIETYITCDFSGGGGGGGRTTYPSLDSRMGKK